MKLEIIEERGLLPMKRLILTSASLAALTVLGLTIAGLIRWRSEVDVVKVLVPTHPLSQTAAGPELEIATDGLAIVRWKGPNPGGTALHYGLVRYGTSAMSLTEVARSPNRRNSSSADMTFRVRVGGLNPHTTYYYTVESVGATGVSDGRPSLVRTFQTR